MAQVKDTAILSPKGTFPATVAKVIDDYKLVINRGSEHGIREGQRMLVYCVSDEDIKDPNTGESLGYLELVRGTGKIIFIQEKISILESDKTKAEIRKIFNRASKSEPRSHTLKTLSAMLAEPEPLETIESKELVPFENPQVGDQVKPI
ncbi:conserved hypothetical protein [Rippkaea orientalis PCC 8801]|uniref:Uncharacterized protein n=1 Tax=Rippkaea orientalis (strain PCC 8801 / RF-1) TaxID=41431 RepID=B7JVB3_RIPO1|nr:hypothetical protein [Rippkaea orientalis]ACK68246.1 conserved hypothetical protein [Rippkaea orientalis PCC 8801]